MKSIYYYLSSLLMLAAPIQITANTNANTNIPTMTLHTQNMSVLMQDLNNLSKPTSLHQQQQLESQLTQIEKLEKDQSVKFSQAELHQLHLPVNTPGMQLTTPNMNQLKAIALPRLIQPIALVGSDRSSLQWLQQHQRQLQQQQALIWLVNAQHIQDIEQVKQVLSNTLAVIAMPATLWVTHYNIQHYPVLLTPKK
jgi:integrating conjugative element protein (TIGR03765 family)